MRKAPRCLLSAAAGLSGSGRACPESRRVTRCVARVMIRALMRTIVCSVGVSHQPLPSPRDGWNGLTAARGQTSLSGPAAGMSA